MTKKPLTIGVDIRVGKVAKTGIRTYIGELRREFEDINRDDLRFHFLDTSIPIYNGHNKLMKWVGHFRFQLWKQVVLPLRAWSKKCDIVFCVDDCVPYIHLGYKTIPVFHDAFYFETPENYGKLWLWIYTKIAIPAAKRSPFVITPTIYSKKQINTFTKIPNERLVVIYEGAKILDQDEVTLDAGQLLTSFALSNGGYILHTGSMFKRKNIPALIHAFSKIKQQGYADLKLVLAGPEPSNKTDNDYKLILDAINDTRLHNEIVLTGYLPDALLGQLYKNALLYVFPSVNEGFGLPVLEAFSYNLPVLVANNTCLPEVGGDAVLQFNPFDIHDMSAKIKTVLDNTELRKEMISKGQKRLEDFSWKATASQIVDVFKKAVNYS